MDTQDFKDKRNERFWKCEGRRFVRKVRREFILYAKSAFAILESRS